MTDTEIQQIIDEIVKPWEGREGNLIMVLHQIQNKFGYVPREISFKVAERLHIPMARIYEVITFFNYFKLEPPGRHVVSVCLGTACYLKGSKTLVAKLHEELGIDPGQTTGDKNFHLQAVRCLGCCGQSPVMAVGPRVYGRLNPDEVHKIIGNYMAAESAAVSGGSL